MFTPSRRQPAVQRSARRLTVLSSVLVGLSLVAPPAAVAAVNTAPDDTARVNGTVYATVQVGDRTVVAGAFTAVGGRTRNHVAVLRANGTLDTGFDADVDGVVNAVAASPDGSTLFLGGRFEEVGGVPRANLAAVDAATGEVLSAWSADTTGTTPEVLALATAGDRVYVGGRFGGIDGTSRKRLVALDATAGTVVKSFQPAPNLAAVRFVAVGPDGDRVFAGGAFDVIGGQSRTSGIAELEAATGLATGFNPAPVGSRVTAMGLSPDASRLYFGVADNRVFAYDVATSALLWTVKNGGDTQAIAVSDTAVYLGGHFGQNLTQKVKRQWIQSLTLEGRVTDWDPRLAGGSMGVWVIVATPTSLLVGGEFVYVGGVNKPRFARFSGTP
jgi:outer membrane protein assembly factor BamB